VVVCGSDPGECGSGSSCNPSQFLPAYNVCTPN
jgi:hypothetical protein